jgi:hypothetical protein
MDMTARKHNRASEEARCLKEYEMELAQGAAHIGSMRYEESIHAAVEETSLLFEILHGRDDLKMFLRALAGRLERRGKPEAVAVLQDLMTRGCSRATEEYWELPPFNRQPRAQRVEGPRPQKGRTSETAVAARKRRRT